MLDDLHYLKLADGRYVMARWNHRQYQWVTLIGEPIPEHEIVERKPVEE